MPNTTYNLLDDDGFLYAVQYIFTKLAASPLAVDTNTTYTIDFDNTSGSEKIVLLDDANHESGSVTVAELAPYFGELNVLEGVQVAGSDLTIANKKVNIPLANGTSGSETNGAMSSSDKAKLDGIATGAQVNVVEGAQIDGTDLTITSKKFQIPNAGANTRGVVSNADINTLIQAAIAGITGISFVKVNSYADLPQTGDSSVIYLVPNSGSAPNIYDEYIWFVDPTTHVGAYEKIGTTAIDLSGYVQYTDISLLTNQEITDIVDDAYDAVFTPTTP